MRACILAVAALLLAAGTGCHGINLAKGNCNGCGCQAACAGQGGKACRNCGHGHFGQGGGQAGPSAYADGGQAGPSAYAGGGNGHGDGAYAGGGGGYGAYGPGHLATHGTPGFPHHGHHRDREYVGPPGPPSAQVAYPYYTIRGPRDFLLDNPPSIGR